MPKPETKYIGYPQSILRRKLMAYEELEKALLRIAKEEEKLVENLVAEAPEELRDFLEDWLKIALKLGRMRGEIRLSEIGCESYKEAKAKLDKLKKFWSHVLTIEFSSEKEFQNGGRLELTISVCL